MPLGTDHDAAGDDHLGIPSTMGPRAWKSLFDQLQEQLVLVDVHGQLLYTNDPSGPAAVAASDGPDPADLRSVVQRVVATGAVERVDVDAVGAADTTASFDTGVEPVALVEVRPFFGDDGAICGAMMIGRDARAGDVTRLAGVHQFGVLADAVPDILMRYDVDGRSTYVDPRWGEDLEADPDAALGVRPTEYTPPGAEGVEEFERVLMEVIATAEPAEASVVALDPSGDRRTHAVLIRPERGPLGQIVGAVVIGRDITDVERLRVETGRRELELRTLAENLPDIVVRYDTDGRATYLNRPLPGYGVPRDSFIGRRPTESDIPGLEDLEEYERILLEVLATGQPSSALLRHTAANGDVTVYSTLMRAEHDPDGSVVGAIAIGRDITDLERAHAEIARREQEYRSLAENLPDVVVRYDRSGRIVYANSRLAEVVEVDEAPRGTRPTEHRLPGVQDVEGYERVLMRVLATGEPATREVRQLMPSGETLRHSVLIRAERDEHGEIVGAIAIGRDVTALVDARQEAADREREFRSLAENAQDYIARWDTAGVRRYVNPALARLHGKHPSELIGLPSRALGDRSNVVAPAIHAVIRDRATRTVQQRLRNPSTGEWMVHDVQLVPEFGPDGDFVGVLGIGRDVTEVLQQRDALQKAASTDLLTGISSRGVLYERLPELVAQRAEDGAIGALLLLDLDGFKAINDHFGHRVGDGILQEAAQMLKRCIGADDLLVRLGGDEFVVVLPSIESPAVASMTAYRARDLLTSLTSIDGTRVPPIDASVGIAFFPADGDRVDDLLAHADLALYEAKRRGRGYVEYFRRDLRAAMERRTAIERALRECDPDQEMSLHLQPIFRLDDEPVMWGAEALLRWEHPTLGALRPDEFIPIAEQSGEILPIGRWVLRRAAELAVHHNRGRREPLQITVNVSSRQFTLDDICAAMLDATAATGCDPSWLTIELTESLLREDLPEVTRSLEMLHELGVSLAIDDFGTGYSALQYLTRLDIDHVKIDKSFVRDADVDEQRREVVRAIIALADALGLGLVAEGIETTSQAEFLRSLGCKLGQGYLLARPMPQDEFERQLGLVGESRPAVPDR